MQHILNRYNQHKVVFENIIFVGLVQVFSLVAPLITYPYLVNVLGLDLYGVVITAQVLVSYATIVIDFGSNSVCAKNVSIHREDKDKLSEIVSSVLTTRFILWLICLGIYLSVVCLIPEYRQYFLLFALSYLMTLNELIFPQFFFQGLEKMKIAALLNILIKLVFIVLIFIFVKESSQYLFVPVLYAAGYMLAGMIAIYMVFKKFGIKYYIPSFKAQRVYFKECSSLLATDLVCTIKDKFNYMLVGGYVNMSSVVIYDLGLKFVGLVGKPTQVIATVLLPRFAKNRNVKQLNIVLWVIILITLILVLLLNLCMGKVAYFFLHQDVDLLPLRIFSIIPIFLAPSVLIANNFFIGFGFNKYLFYSIVATTIIYLMALLCIWISGYIDSLYSFVFLACISYISEFLYRILMYRKLSTQI